MAGVASIVQRRLRAGVARGGYPMPVSNVRPFTGADATDAALLVKLGSRIWDGVKERAAEEYAQREQNMREALTQAQIEKLVAESNQPRMSMNIGGQSFEGLKPYEAATIAARLQSKGGGKPARKGVTVGPDGKVDLTGVELTPSEALTLKGQGEVGDRAAAARRLSEKLAEMRLNESASSRRVLDTATNANRVLSQIPEAPSEGEVNAAAYTAADDSLAKFKGWGRPDRKTLAGQLAPRERGKLQAGIDARRKPYLQILDLASRAAGTSREAQSTLEQLRQLLQPE